MDYTRIVGGAFVPAELVLDVTARDYGSMDVNVEWNMDQVTHADTNGAWVNWFDVYVGLPDTWNIDPAWGLTLQVSLEVFFSIHAGGGGGTTYQYRLTTIGTTVSGNGWKNLVLNYPLDGSLAIPTGMYPFTVQLNINTSGGVSVDAERAVGTRGMSTWRLTTI